MTPEYLFLGLFVFLITIALLNVWANKRETRLKREAAEKRMRESEENRARNEELQEKWQAESQVHLANKLKAIQDVGKFLEEGDYYWADNSTSHALRNKHGEIDIDFVDVEILEELDRLWSRVTNGRFGFTAQLDLGETHDEIIANAGIPHWWDWPNTRIYDISAPPGHLPMDWLFSEEIRGMDDDRALQHTGQFKKLRAKLKGKS